MSNLSIETHVTVDLTVVVQMSRYDGNEWDMKHMFASTKRRRR